MNLTQPMVPVSGDVLDAPRLDLQRDFLWAGVGPDNVQVYQDGSGAQSIPHATWTTLLWNAEASKSQPGLHSTSSNTSRIVCQTAGYHRIRGRVVFNAANVAGARGARIMKNGAGPPDGAESVKPGSAAAFNLQPWAQGVDWILYLNATDYVELQGYQDTGGALSTTTNMGIYTSNLDVQWLCP